MRGSMQTRHGATRRLPGNRSSQGPQMRTSKSQRCRPAWWDEKQFFMFVTIGTVALVDLGLPFWGLAQPQMGGALKGI